MLEKVINIQEKLISQFLENEKVRSVKKALKAYCFKVIDNLSYVNL